MSLSQNDAWWHSHGWGCKPLQTASNIYMRYKLCCESSHAVHMHMGAPLYIITTTKLAKMLVIMGQMLSQNDAWCHGWCCKPLQTVSNFHIRSNLSVCASSHAVHMHLGAPIHCCYISKVGPEFEICGSVIRFSQNNAWCHSHGWGCKPLQTAFNIHIQYSVSVWASSHAVHMHMGAPLHFYSSKVGPEFEICGSLIWFSRNDAWYHSLG